MPFRGSSFHLRLFFSPAKSGKAIWGIGSAFQLHTGTDGILGQDKWCAGATGVILAMKGPIVFGMFANNVWPFAGADDVNKPHMNQMLRQPFFNYNFRSGRHLTSVPIITAN